MMLRTLASASLLLAVIAPVQADDCPNAKTARLGFVLERQGIRAEVRPTVDHFVHVQNLYPGGKRQDVIYYRGLFPISRFDDTARSINVPVSDIRTVFPLEAKSRRALTYAPAEPGKVGALLSLEISVSGQEKLELGPCSYDVLVVRNRTLNAEGRVLGSIRTSVHPNSASSSERDMTSKGAGKLWSGIRAFALSAACRPYDVV
jgi:hypothetical protein